MAFVFLLVALSLLNVHLLEGARTSKRIVNPKRDWEIDTNAMLQANPFAVKPERLIERAKEIIDNELGLLNPDDLAEDFTFQFPIIGPLNKNEYITAVKGFQIKEAFPDLTYSYYNFHVDPFETNRVWAHVLFRGTHTGVSVLGKPTGKLVDPPPQAVSFAFNEEGKLSRFTGGYVLDKTIGNTGGLGGIFGILYGIGRPLPFPEGKPWKPSLRFRFFSFIGQLAQRFSKK